MQGKKYKTQGIWWSDANRMETNVKVFEDSVYFSSIFELDVYRHLIEFPSVFVYRQHRLKIKDATENYPGIYWRCDFRVESRDDSSRFLNIEVKGLVLPGFKNTIKYLEYFSPAEYSRLVLITKRRQKVDRYLAAWRLSDISDLLAVHKMR